MTEPEAQAKKTPLIFPNDLSDDTQIRDGESALVESLTGDPKRPTLNKQVKDGKISRISPLPHRAKPESLTQKSFAETIENIEQFEFKEKNHDDNMIMQMIIHHECIVTHDRL